MTDTALLAGVRILAVEQYGAGPYGTMLLAALGAEVIKIENPATGGDVSRATGPYFLGNDDSQFFQTFSRGKKSVALDLKSPAGRAAFERLVAGADAVANNLRGDQPEKLALTYPALRGINPKIVCAHLSAYGRGNPRESWPGYDYLMQAEAGFMSMTGEPDGPPVRFGLSMVDFMTGTMMATALLAAVLKARAAGEGADVDVSLFDTALHQLSYPATWHLNEGVVVGRLARGAIPSIAPSQAFTTADGWLMLMCQTEKFWEAFCAKIERPDIAADPRFSYIAERRRNIAALTETLDAVFATRPTAAWMALLGGTVPVAPVLDVAQALDNPFARGVGMIDRMEHPDRAGGLDMLAAPVLVNGVRPHTGRAPKLGEHTAEYVDARERS